MKVRLFLLSNKACHVCFDEAHRHIGFEVEMPVEEMAMFIRFLENPEEFTK
jgi:hypothetical protein